MVLLVCLEMIRKLQNSLAQDRNLYFWRTAICFVRSMLLDYTLLNFSRQRHTSERYSSSALISFLYAYEHSTFAPALLATGGCPICVLDPSVDGGIATARSRPP